MSATTLEARIDALEMQVQALRWERLYGAHAWMLAALQNELERLDQAGQRAEHLRHLIAKAEAERAEVTP